MAKNVWSQSVHYKEVALYTYYVYGYTYCITRNFWGEFFRNFGNTYMTNKFYGTYVILTLNCSYQEYTICTHVSASKHLK